MTDRKEFQRFEQNSFVSKWNWFLRTRPTLWRWVFARNDRSLGDQSRQLPTFELFTFLDLVHAVFLLFISVTVWQRPCTRKHLNELSEIQCFIPSSPLNVGSRETLRVTSTQIPRLRAEISFTPTPKFRPYEKKVVCLCSFSEINDIPELKTSTKYLSVHFQLPWGSTFHTCRSRHCLKKHCWRPAVERRSYLPEFNKFNNWISRF